jgi:hypothetical protein
MKTQQHASVTPEETRAIAKEAYVYGYASVDSTGSSTRTLSNRRALRNWWSSTDKAVADKHRARWQLTAELMEATR